MRSDLGLAGPIARAHSNANVILYSLKNLDLPIPQLRAELVLNETCRIIRPDRLLRYVRLRDRLGTTIRQRCQQD